MIKDDELLIYGVTGYPASTVPCEVCGQPLVKLTFRKANGSTHADFFEVVHEADDILNAAFLQHSDRHIRRQQ